MANDCQQKCENSEGSYRCSCNQGFILNSDNRSCDGELPRQHILMYIQLSIRTYALEQLRWEYIHVVIIISLAPIWLFINLPIVSSALEVCHTNHGCSHGCAIVNNTEQCFCPSGYALQNITHCNGMQVVYVVCWYMYTWWFLMTNIYIF